MMTTKFSIPETLTSHVAEYNSSTSFWQALVSRMQTEAYEKKQNFDMRYFKANVFNTHNVRDFINNTVGDFNFYTTALSNGDYYLFYDWGIIHIVSYATTPGYITIWGDPDEIQKWIDVHPIWKTDKTKINVDWCFKGVNNDVQKLQVQVPVIPILETAFPWIKKPISEYVAHFNSSTANVLILLGVPGTGKTTLIKNILSSRDGGQESIAMLTYDEELLYHDAFFCTFMGSDSVQYMVIEDADNLLLSRTEGNSLMRKFLNIGDGLTTIQNKKLIFSTNLPNVHDIDNALLRPGRCFDVLQFRPLTYCESQAVLEEAGKKKELDPLKSYTLAELVAASEYVPPDIKFGFTR